MPLTCPACNNLISEIDAICPCCGASLAVQNPAPETQALSHDADSKFVVSGGTPAPEDADSTLVANRRPPAQADADSTLLTDGSYSGPTDTDATRCVAAHIPPDSPSSAAGASGQGNAPSTRLHTGESFMGYVLEERIASSGREAEIFRVRQSEGQYVLKLYHYDVAPKKEILDKMREISEQFPECVVRIYGCGQDPVSERWYEFQEYVRNGSLRDIMPDLSQSMSKNPNAAIAGQIVREIAEALIVLHAKGIMHCDLKPANILVRSLEPLDLVLTDFGVSSMLDPEASSRATGVKGSPMYQAPETFTGHVTRSLDWWALGCITFEILLGRHPFSGLNPNEIMLKLVQFGIDLSELDFSSPPLRDFELLLKGLLTSDYQKRWGGKEVCRWFDGGRDIPVHYLKTQQALKLTPFLTEERAYDEISELLASFTESEKAWKRGLEALYRGELEIWLTGNRQEEDQRKVAEVKNRYIDKKDLQDAGLFKLIYAYNPQLPFRFCGMKIDVTNLRLLCGKQARKEQLTQAEASVAKVVSDGMLMRLYQHYLEVAQTRDDELESVFDLLKKTWPPERQWDCLRAVFAAPEEYYWPPFACDLIKSQPRDRLDFLRQRRTPFVCPLNGLRNCVMTLELAIKMQNPASYDEFLTEMERLLSEPYAGQTADAQPMVFSNCDGRQFTVRIVPNRLLPPPPPSKKKNVSPSSLQSEPRQAENTGGNPSDVFELAKRTVKSAATRVAAEITDGLQSDFLGSIRGAVDAVTSRASCEINGHTWFGGKCTRCGETWDAEHTFEPIETEFASQNIYEKRHSKMAKNKWVSFFLCLFLGLVGMHKFYEGKVLLGILYLCTGGLFGIGVVIDLIVLFSKPNPYYP